MAMDQETDLLELSGTVEAVIYKNEENGYTVLRLRDGSGENVTVVGCFPYAAAGESMIVSGQWMMHSVHGRQFKAEFAQRILPTSASAIYDFLAGGSVKGIGPATAALIVDRFGDRALDVMLTSPGDLAAIKGISAAKAKQISASFRQQAGVRMLMEFVCSFGLRPVLAMRMHRFYGEEAMETLKENPYVLCSALIGGTFAEADTMALELGMEGGSSKRIDAALLFELAHNTGNGHCFIPREKLAAATAELIGVEPEDVDECIGGLIESGDMKYEEIAGCRACYLPELYEAETYVCRRILSMAEAELPEPKRLDALLETIEDRQEIDYAPEQLAAIRAAAAQQLLIVTGGPGTGKTTVMAGILQLFDELKLKTQLAAPTGRAAKRLSEVTGREASTIHRLLEAQFDEQTGAMAFYHDEDAPLSCDAMIVDETSMVDLPLMASLLKALKPGCRLLLVGDPDQLPPVGPGNVFSDLIRSGMVQTVRLTQIFRQAQKSLIVMNAHAVNQGELPRLTATDRDFFFLRRRDPAAAVRTIQELCQTRLPKNMGIAPADIQVLSPSRKHETGTKALNLALQAVLNPPADGKKEKKHGDFSFRIGDRVMQIRNNYDIMWKRADGLGAGTGIFNGDIGCITQIDFQQETMTVQFDEKTAEYSFDMLSELEPAYAMTVHKSQGSEYRAVVLCLCGGPQMLLTRSVLYTAITRARELLIIVGNEDVVAAMTRNDRRQRRYSGLKLRLEGKV